MLNQFSVRQLYYSIFVTHYFDCVVSVVDLLLFLALGYQDLIYLLLSYYFLGKAILIVPQSAKITPEISVASSIVIYPFASK